MVILLLQRRGSGVESSFAAPIFSEIWILRSSLPDELPFYCQKPKNDEKAHFSYEKAKGKMDREGEILN